MFLLCIVSLSVLSTAVRAQTLNVHNKCSEPVFLFTDSAIGNTNDNVSVASGDTVDLGISSNWNGGINIGTGCNSEGSCTTGGPKWDGSTPYSRAEFNFNSNPGSVTYDLSLIYGYNVGMQITSGEASCDAFACTLPSGCPVPGPDSSCYSPCCSSASACSGGALPVGGGGCLYNAGPGPNSPFYYTNCQNAYTFPDNDGSDGWQPANLVDYTCANTSITLTLCPSNNASTSKSDAKPSLSKMRYPFQLSLMLPLVFALIYG